MSRGINRVTLVGHLGDDPTIRYTQSGSAIATLSVATSESWKDKEGQQQERTEWHRCKAFGKLAEICGEYLKKGRQVYVEGSLRTEKYTDKAGVEKYSTDIILSEMQMLGGKEGDSGGQRTERPQRGGGAGKPAPSTGPTGNDDPFPDDDIPFITNQGRW